MANQEQLAILKQKVKHWNEWRQRYPAVEPNLSYADLSGANLVDAHLSYTNLSYADLSGAFLAQGVRCWFAPEDLKIGDRFHTRINEAIHVQDKLLLLISEHSLTSDWVEIEVRAALEKEQRQHRDVLFPIRLDNSVVETTQAWASRLRQSRHIGDFTHWKEHDEYQKGFNRLLRDLKQEAIHDTIESDADQDQMQSTSRER